MGFSVEFYLEFVLIEFFLVGVLYLKIIGIFLCICRLELEVLLLVVFGYGVLFFGGCGKKWCMWFGVGSLCNYVVGFRIFVG